MSFEPASSLDASRPRSSSAWFRAPALWAGLSIVTMWLAVLFVGVFGGNIVSSTPGGTSTSVPVVVALIPFVLVATVVVARRGFRDLADEQRGTPSGTRIGRVDPKSGDAHEQTQAPTQPTAERSDLRTKLA